MMQFRGVFPIVNTPFFDDGRIDLDSQRRLVRFLLACGAHGLGLFGNASEGYTLSEEERRALLGVTLEEVQGRIPVVVSTGHTGTDIAVELGREAEHLGAAALMVLPPYYVKPDGDGIFRYFESVASAVTIPVMVQDAPLMTQVPMGADLLARMAAEIRGVSLVKVEAPPTPPKVTRLRQLAGDSLTLFGGLNGHFLLEELQRGAVGTMPGSDLTDRFVEIWNLVEQADTTTARTKFNALLPLIRYELQPGLGVAVMKYNLHKAGIIASPRVRHPTKTIGPLEAQEVDALRADLDLLAFRWSEVGS
jgi:2-keto-3-deoxy-L-arabinonate dehydratase